MLSIKSIRNNFTRFGYDLSHLTDEELQWASINLHRVMSNSGITVDEATKAAIEFSKVLNNASNS